MRIARLSALLILLVHSFASGAQVLSDEAARAGRLYRGYDFEGALAIYDKLLAAERDSAAIAMLQEKVLLCENGLNLIRFASQPEVVARRSFAVEDFFLYYSHLADGGWIAGPNAFSPGKQPLYFEPGCRSLVFTAPDEEGRHRLYLTTLGEDGLWRTPEVVEKCTSSGNELFPLVSASGKDLYFSSDALAGMGGYDLFVSRWNERRKCWDAPENLGFPYSSVGDDFLFSNTPDGEFTLLASNRDCSPDSMTIYVLRFENSPVSKTLSTPAEAARIASLTPSSTDSQVAGDDVAYPFGNEGGEAFLRWKAALERLEAVRRTIAETRSSLSHSTEERMMDLQRLSGRIADTVVSLELDLIAAGGTPDYKKNGTEATPGRVAAGQTKNYGFSRRSFGALGEIAFEKVETEEDTLAFTIGDIGRIVNEFPAGIVFQIQLAVTSSKMNVKQLRGISPVFAIRQGSGKYLHTAGAFRSYSEAAAALPLVKRAGFPSAYIVAFRDGRSIAVSKARAETEP